MKRLLSFVTLFCTLTAAPLFAATGEVLQYFNGKDGANPSAGVIFDAQGNLYGTTDGGGTYNRGVVFELSPNPTGFWTETVLYSFSGVNGDGRYPYAGLVFDSLGNLYGTTAVGGAFNCVGSSQGCGTVFELSPGQNGTWTETVLHSFDGRDGALPYASLIIDAAGNLYGTTGHGGSGANCPAQLTVGCGIVFELSPTQGAWTESVLYNFCSLAQCKDGFGPFAGLIFDAAGNLYGTTSDGGAYSHCNPSCGTVFELTPGNGAWTESVLFSFKGKYGADPEDDLIFDAKGNIYGTTRLGHGNGGGGGVAFELSPANGAWTETVLHGFNRDRDGQGPNGPLVFDASGNLYGTTQAGGSNERGLVFELSPPQNGGKWKQTTLLRFSTRYGRGSSAGLVSDSQNNLYGTIYGPYGGVFKVTP